MTKLSKHKGTSKDTRGCEFHYTCLKSSDEGTLYYCNEFPEVEAKTLTELKYLIGLK